MAMLVTGLHMPGQHSLMCCRQNLNSLIEKVHTESPVQLSGLPRHRRLSRHKLVSTSSWRPGHTLRQKGAHLRHLHSGQIATSRCSHRQAAAVSNLEGKANAHSWKQADSADLGYSAVVILLHGLGSDPTGLHTQAFRDHMRCKELSHVKWVHPRAPVQPVSANDGKEMRSWFDVAELPACPEAPPIPSPEDQVMGAVETVHSIIEDEVGRGIKASRVLVGGFSQGGATAVSSVATYPEPLAGAAIMWGWVPLEPRVFSEKVEEAAKSTPVLWSHGEQDSTVSIGAGKKGADLLSENGMDVEMKAHSQAGHKPHKDELELIKGWILERLPQDNYPDN